MPGSQSSVFDSELYSSLFTQPEMKSIWSDDNLLRCWLTFEATIAHVQTELGIIPPEAAAENFRRLPDAENRLAAPRQGNAFRRYGD